MSKPKYRVVAFSTGYVPQQKHWYGWDNFERVYSDKEEAVAFLERHIRDQQRESAPEVIWQDGAYVS